MIQVIVLIASPHLDLLYQILIQQLQGWLVDTINRQRRLIEAVASFNTMHSQTAVPGNAAVVTLSSVVNEKENYSIVYKTRKFLQGWRAM